tara:strand:- start:1393 stop:2415 length:1023 start_codon:yes stop_codon:yes gene_type:complete
MFKTLDPGDIRITPFKVGKEFTVTNVDSGSGVYSFRAISGSLHNFLTGSANVRIYPNSASFYSGPSWALINNMYYKQINASTKKDWTELNPYDNFGANGDKQYRNLHTSASIISVPQKLFGERIKPGSITLTDDSGTTTLTIKDDGDGNLYDNNYSSSYAKFRSGSLANGKFDFGEITATTGSVVGNVFYDHGVIVMTDTGSKYIDVGQKEGTDGFSLRYKAQETIREYEYTCVIGENEFNGTMNISATKERSGSISVVGSDAWRLFPPGHATAKSGSFSNSYTAANKYEGFVTHSEFRPYVTKVGLYNDFNQLIAIGQLSAPIKNEKDIALGIVVRFDA